MLCSLAGNKRSEFLCFFLKAFQSVNPVSIGSCCQNRTGKHRLIIHKYRTQSAVGSFASSFYTAAALLSDEVNQQHIRTDLRLCLLSI